MLPESTMYRLALIKYWYSCGDEQTRQAEPLCGMSLLALHDSAELFLQLAAEQLGVSKDSKSFMEYWDILSRKMQPNELSHKMQMEKLNKARVSLKHYGILPSKNDIEHIRTSITDFFETNTPLIFNISFNNINMTSMVRNEPAKTYLESAQSNMGVGEYSIAITETAVAFAYLIRDYEENKIIPGNTAFSLGKNLSAYSATNLGLSDMRRIGKCVDDVLDSIATLRDAVKILCLGIDYRRYFKFRLLTPDIELPYLGQHFSLDFYAGRNEDRRGAPPTPEECKFCFDFVIEAAINLQSFNYKIAEYIPSTYGSSGKLVIDEG